MKLSDPTGDRALLQRLQKGDHAAFEQIYYLCKTKLIVNLLRLLKSPDLVEELMQDLFLKLWEHRRKIDIDKPIQAYLYKIAQNMAYDIFRKASRDKKLHEQLLYSLEQSYISIEDPIFSSENKTLLHEAIDMMPPKRRKVFILCKLEDKSYEEVSKLMDISTGTINVHIRLANRFLKEYFASRQGLTVSVLTCLILQGFA